MPVYAQQNTMWLKHEQKKTPHNRSQNAPLPNFGNLPPSWEPMLHTAVVFTVWRKMLRSDFDTDSCFGITSSAMTSLRIRQTFRRSSPMLSTRKFQRVPRPKPRDGLAGRWLAAAVGRDDQSAIFVFGCRLGNRSGWSGQWFRLVVLCKCAWVLNGFEYI